MVAYSEKQIVGGCFGCYTFIAFALAIASSSWMINQNNSESWKNTILNFTNSATASMSVLEQSWDVKPFVDVVLTDRTICPETHPDDLIYEVWLGTRGLCDCLERAGDRIVHLEGLC